MEQKKNSTNASATVGSRRRSHGRIETCYLRISGFGLVGDHLRQFRLFADPVW